MCGHNVHGECKSRWKQRNWLICKWSHEGCCAALCIPDAYQVRLGPFRTNDPLLLYHHQKPLLQAAHGKLNHKLFCVEKKKGSGRCEGSRVREPQFPVTSSRWCPQRGRWDGEGVAGEQVGVSMWWMWPSGERSGRVSHRCAHGNRPCSGAGATACSAERTESRSALYTLLCTLSIILANLTNKSYWRVRSE